MAQVEIRTGIACLEPDPVRRNSIPMVPWRAADRLGQLEDRFFATVFFGSALLFLAILFAAAAIAGAFVLAFSEWPDDIMRTDTFHFARAITYSLMNVYAIKMAGMFMISTSTVVIYTAIAPRWIAILGYILALTLLIGSYYIGWSFMVLPIWVFSSAFLC